MTRQSRSTSTAPNPDFSPLPREPGEGNLAWGQRAARAMRTPSPADWTFIALLGGADTLSFRCRVAQSHLRPDMQPSYWSQALMVLLEDASLAGAQALHVPLLQPAGPDFGPRSNGVTMEPLAAFDDPAAYPNIALIALPVAQAKIQARVQAFMRSRSTLDALEHVLRWLAFAWGVARTGNPLFDNYGLPSACMLEAVCAAEGYDLTPGLESRASCPEAIWIAARHWHDYYEKTGSGIPFGRFTVDHGYPILEGERVVLPQPPQPPAAPKPKKARPKGPKKSKA
ncbi:hypothetical protein [Pelomonas sp. KK5]|uniref:hypothetical protein n=1 Tax=Pelomonas sp. KK5 TaxID=1855730 RepID=UPI00097BB59F|nr:hypothetical protein [Pelomonas sp. KK5]